MCDMESQRLFQFTLSLKLGRHLIAARTIEAGEVVIDEPALVEGPSSLNSAADLPVCPACYRRVKGLLEWPCTICNLSLCSDVCSKAILHSSNECQLLSRIPSLLLSIGPFTKDLHNFITTSRALFVRSRDPLKWKQIMQLESRSEILLKEKSPIFDRLDQALSLLTWSDFDVSNSDISLATAAHHCLGVLRTNAFSEFTEVKGREGLYFFSSFMAHSCVMNTWRQFDAKSSRVVVRAATQIEKGQPITNTYLSCLSNTGERAEELEAIWGFQCDCLRCGSLTEMDTFLGSIKCPDCGYMTLCPLTDGSWTCATENCGSTFEKGDSRLSSTMKQIQEIQDSMPNLDLENIANIERWITESNQKSFLNSNHSLFIQTKLYLLQSYGKAEGIDALSTEQILKKASFCSDVLNIVNKLYSGLYLLKGTILFEYWNSFREILHRKLTADSANDSQLGVFQNLPEEAVSRIAFDAYSILKYSLPSTNEDAMMNILDEECVSKQDITSTAVL